MSIKFKCVHCKKPLEALPSHAGAKIKCSHCGQQVDVPGKPTKRHSGESMLADIAEEALPMPKKVQQDDEVDMTPMIDMTFLLLIFFMVTASFTLQRSITIPTPDTESNTAPPQQRDNNNIVVRIDADNTIWVDDNEAPTRQELLAQLREARESSKAGDLIVQASGGCRHEKVVMALDAGYAVGIENVRLATMNEDE